MKYETGVWFLCLLANYEIDILLRFSSFLIMPTHDFLADAFYIPLNQNFYFLCFRGIGIADTNVSSSCPWGWASDRVCIVAEFW
jgi:hypothetical protein